MKAEIEVVTEEGDRIFTSADDVADIAPIIEDFVSNKCKIIRIVFDYEDDYDRLMFLAEMERGK